MEYVKNLVLLGWSFGKGNKMTWAIFFKIAFWVSVCFTVIVGVSYIMLYKKEFDKWFDGTDGGVVKKDKEGNYYWGKTDNPPSFFP